METQKPLSQLGIGPFYAATVILLTLAALLLDRAGLLPDCELPELPLKVLAVICALTGVLLWVHAVIVGKITRHIRENQLVTTGVYGWVRNPIYSAFMFLMWGVLLWNGNAVLLILCPVYPLLMTVMVKYTEEKWLAERYGRAYRDYCRNVWRCIPRPPIKRAAGKVRQNVTDD